MHNKANDFLENSTAAIQDSMLQVALTRGTGNSMASRIRAMGEVSDAAALRAQGRAAKFRALRKLPDLLEQFETKVTERGATVLWAEDSAEANQYVLEIARKHGVRSVVKGKSMVTEETGLNHVLEDAGLKVVETDLGEFIVQVDHDTPSHIVMPVIHKTREQIRDLFVERLNMPYTEAAEDMTAFANKILRREFLGADMGITGANFLIAETGTAVIVTNEGNGRMCSSVPRVHVVMVGIEKMVETMDDFATLLQLLTRSSTGQRLSVYTHMMSGPALPTDPDGPEFMYFVLVDNGRARIRETGYAEALACLRCGACLSTCPVYQNVGGHAYGSVYSGPIGAVLTPLFNGLSEAALLPHASSLCGACQSACPVDIHIPDMLLRLRADLVQEGETQMQLALGLKGWAQAMQSPRLYALAGKAASAGTRLIARGESSVPNLPGILGNWTKYRDFPPFAPKSFHDLWREREEGS